MLAKWCASGVPKLAPCYFPNLGDVEMMTQQKDDKVAKPVSKSKVGCIVAEHQACTHPQSVLHHATGEIMQDFAQRAGAEWRHQWNGTRNA